MNKKITSEADFNTQTNPEAVTASGSLGLLALGAKGVKAWKAAKLAEQNAIKGKEAGHDK